jgi:hypothetical protein
MPSPDDPSIRPWAPRQPVDHRRLNILQERVVTDITVGPGLRLWRKGNSVSIGLMDSSRRATAPEVWVRISGTESQDGCYSGNLITWPSAAVDPATVDHTTFGTAGEAAFIINKGPEIGDSGHALRESPINSTDFRGTVIGMTNEETPRRVVVINGVDIGACTPA